MNYLLQRACSNVIFASLATVIWMVIYAWWVVAFDSNHPISFDTWHGCIDFVSTRLIPIALGIRSLFLFNTILQARASTEKMLHRNWQLVVNSLELQDEPSQPPVHNNIACAVCMQQQREVMFRPCKHICACTKCTTTLLYNERGQCPLCKKGIDAIERVYL